MLQWILPLGNFDFPTKSPVGEFSQMMVSEKESPESAPKIPKMP